jgi:hypothetical protein
MAIISLCLLAQVSVLIFFMENHLILIFHPPTPLSL